MAVQKIWCSQRCHSVQVNKFLWMSSSSWIRNSVMRVCFTDQVHMCELNVSYVAEVTVTLHAQCDMFCHTVVCWVVCSGMTQWLRLVWNVSTLSSYYPLPDLLFLLFAQQRWKEIECRQGSGMLWEPWVVMRICSPLNQELFKFKSCQWENNNLWIKQKHEDLLLYSKQ